MRKITVLSSFILKIAAIVFMTLDHVGLLLSMLYPTDLSIVGTYGVATIFRTFGRLALPLFAFMIVEGVIHTKNIKKYFLRLGILAALISIAFIVIEYSSLSSVLGSLLRAGNIFLDLLLLAVAVYLLKQPKLPFKFLTLLIVGFSVLSFVVKGIEESTGFDLYWYPAFLTMQYDWFTIVLGIAFYFSYYVADTYIKLLENYSGVNKDMWVENGNYRLLVNICSIFFLVVISIFFYLFTYFWPNGVFWDASAQVYAIFSGAFILLYNGKRGYNAKWFQYGSYIYYPLHILIIGIIYVISIGGL